MRHPTIRQNPGLPPTSNIPWSEEGEKRERFFVWFCWSALWSLLVLAVIAIFRHLWLLAIFQCAGVGLFVWRLMEHRARYFAMRLNRPRSTQQLTQWTEHPWLGWEIIRRQFVCECSRDIDLSRATYFKDTHRFAVVCDCGRGHFQVPPPLKMGRVLEELPRARRRPN
jgi:hypothetical protein